MAIKKKQLTDRDYILQHLVYGKGLHGPQISFTFADGSAYSICDCSGRSMRVIKGELTESAIAGIMRYKDKHPIQPNQDEEKNPIEK